ncbi:imidazole glycerol phosphate synthase subunit HisH [Dongia soli]|uniref:Imidazole glycerol phosphate synthase subunit HisH n=1 Tax=Dongia soli TaxID=600628 RepID=A0ABU5E754_9PROT|nr:imidazole glycerol phosphate synthase subunit HisH [Dongia soli]MDY0882011.1 imidazole glycerol phosphate synthase subunit HisH [Dongia soli]
MTTVVIDYGAGNLRSVAKALGTVAAESRAGEVIVSDDPTVIRRANRIVLPGVGAFADCKKGLESRPGVIDALAQSVLEAGRPFLGICVGMQLMATEGVEYGTHPGLDWIKGKVVKLTPDDPGLKIPQMGWNDLKLRSAHPVFAGLESGDHGYFVHSYHFITDRPEDVLAAVDYGGEITAVIGRDNLIGVQFHPEKSQKVGLKLLANFLAWKP